MSLLPNVFNRVLMNTNLQQVGQFLHRFYHAYQDAALETS